MPPLFGTNTARPSVRSDLCVIPLFAEKPAHSSVPLDRQAAVGRSGGQERPKAGACALLLTAASTAARSRPKGTARIRRSAIRAAAAALTIGIGMSGIAASAAQAERARNSTTVVSRTADPYAEHIADASRRFSIPAAWIRAVMRVESTNNPRALSPKGAIGLMQIMPATWRELRVRHALGTDPYDPRDNVLAGAAYLREMHDRFGSPGFLAAYNAGSERYAQHLATGAALPAETQNYLAMLAPLIDGSQSERTANNADNTPNWRSASLFTAPIHRKLNDPRYAASLLPSPTFRDATIVDLSALGPPSNGLFIRRTDKDRAR